MYSIIYTVKPSLLIHAERVALYICSSETVATVHLS